MKRMIKLLLILICLQFGAINTVHSTIYFEYNFSGGGNFQYDYGSWTGSITAGTSYVTIDTGLNGTNGGAGWAFPSVDTTLTPPANTYIVIGARLRNTHNGTPIQVALVTTPGTDFTVWSAPASLFNTTSFTTVYIPLSDPPVFTSGTGVNLANIVEFQLQGNYSSTADFDIEVQYVALVPEPQQAALAIFLCLGCAIAVARKKFFKPRTAEV